MSAHTKKVEIALPTLVIADEEWERYMQKPGLRVMDVFGTVKTLMLAKWAGPCEPMQSIFKRLKAEYADSITFVQAQTDYIEALKNFRDKSCPTFLLYFNEVLVKIVKGANAPLLEKIIKEQLDIEKNGGVHKPAAIDPASEVLVVDPSTVPPLPPEASEPGPRSSMIRPAHHPHPVEREFTLPSDATETFALLKPDAMAPGIIEGIFEQIRQHRFHIMKMKKIWMTPEVVEEFYQEHREKTFFPALVTYFTSGPSLALILAKVDCVTEWRKLIGPANSKKAKEEDPKTLRAYFGTDNRINAVFGSDSQESAKREIEIFFGESSKVIELPFSEAEHSAKKLVGVQKTLCLIKSENDLIRDSIIERIICRGIMIYKREEMTLDLSQVEGLYPKLKDKNPEAFAQVSEFLTKHAVLALVLKSDGVIDIMKEMAGDEDPEIARNNYPNSIRALYGENLLKNAVHVSESVDIAVSQIQLIFPYILERGSTVDMRLVPQIDHTSVRASMEQLHAKFERTLALIKPDAYGNGKKDDIVERVLSEGFTIVKEAEIQFNNLQVQEFYKEHITKPFFEDLVIWMSGSPIYAMVLEKENAIGAWRELAGPTNSVKAKEIAPTSIRAMFGTDGTHNAVHGSDSPSSAEREIRIVFGDEISPDPLPLPAEIEPENVPDLQPVTNVQEQQGALFPEPIVEQTAPVTLETRSPEPTNQAALEAQQRSMHEEAPYSIEPVYQETPIISTAAGNQETAINPESTLAETGISEQRSSMGGASVPGTSVPDAPEQKTE